MNGIFKHLRCNEHNNTEKYSINKYFHARIAFFFQYHDDITKNKINIVKMEIRCMCRRQAKL